MHSVIEELRQDAAQDQEALRARFRMIEILDQAVEGLEAAGFAPVLEKTPGALVVLRLDSDAWALRQVAPALVPPVPPLQKVDLGRLSWTPDPGFINTNPAPAVPNPIFQPNTCAVPVAGPHADVPQVVAPAPAKAPSPSASRPGRRSVWTPEIDAKIIAMRASGKTGTEIAKFYGVTPSSVDNRFFRLRKAGAAVPDPIAREKRGPLPAASARADGSAIQPWDDKATSRLCALYEDGQELKAIAEAMGRSLKSVSVQLTRLRAAGKVRQRRAVSPHAAKWPEDRIAQLRDLWPRMPAKDVAEQMGLSRGSVSAMAHRLGLLRDRVDPVADVPVEVADADPVPEQKSEPLVAPEPVASISAPVPEVEPKLDPEPAVEARTFQPSPGGKFAAPGSRPMHFAAAPKVLTGMTTAEKEALMAAHCAALPAAADFGPEEDLELCEAVFSGAGLNLFCADFGIDSRAALARFDRIVEPLREHGRKALPIEAGRLVLSALRNRLRASRGVAA